MSETESNAWAKDQVRVWGNGPEFRRVCESIGRRNDQEGVHEADDLVTRMLEVGTNAINVADAVVYWALQEMPREGAYERARERYFSNRDWLTREMDGPGYPNGSPLAERPPHSTVHTVVNCLLRGRTGDRA